MPSGPRIISSEFSTPILFQRRLLPMNWFTSKGLGETCVPIGTTLKFIRGHAFRAPNYFERVFNANLVPEKITSHELVYEQGIGRNLRSSVSGFYNDIEHLINFSGGTYQNVQGATAKGVELELQGFW